MIAMLRPAWAAGVVSLLAFAVAPLASGRDAGPVQAAKTAAEVLACGREALGGRALAAVSALQLTVETTPDASQRRCGGSTLRP